MGDSSLELHTKNVHGQRKRGWQVFLTMLPEYGEMLQLSKMEEIRNTA